MRRLRDILWGPADESAPAEELMEEETLAAPPGPSEEEVRELEETLAALGLSELPTIRDISTKLPFTTGYVRALIATGQLRTKRETPVGAHRVPRKDIAALLLREGIGTKDDVEAMWKRITASRAAELLGVSRGTVSKYVRTGRIRARYFGGRYWLNADDVKMEASRRRKRPKRPSPKQRLEQRIEENPHDPHAYFDLAMLQMRPRIKESSDGHPVIKHSCSSEAEDNLVKALALGLGDSLSTVKANYLLGCLRRATDLFARRFQHIKPTRKSSERHRQAYEHWARNAKPLFDEALRHCKRYLRANPYSFEALVYLANIYQALGNTEQHNATLLKVERARELKELGVTAREKRAVVKAKKSGLSFEEKCLRVMEAMGFTATTTSATSDGGIDIVAVSTQPLFSGKYIVQCKDWSNPVGEPVLRDLYGVVHAENANKGVLITTSTLTKAAQRFAEEKPLELIDGEQLEALIRSLESK